MELIPFRFGEVDLKESCWLNNEPYFSRRAIGEWLEYENPQKAIDNIIERNPHIENPAWSTTLKLRAVDGKLRDVELYNPIGLQLVVMESRQPKAVQYKIAVAHLVLEFMRGNVRLDAKKHVPKTAEPLEHGWFTIRQIARTEDKSESAIRKRIILKKYPECKQVKCNSGGKNGYMWLVKKGA